MKKRSIVPAVALITVLAACSDTAPTGPEPTLAAAVVAPPGEPFTATEFPVALLDPGQVRSADGRHVIRGLTVQARIDATDARVSGYAVITANGVLAETDGSGPVWGNVTIEVDGGGSWVGRWHGRRAPSGPVWVAELSMNLRGVGGPVGGMHLAATDVITSFALIPSGYVGQLAGTIR